ncbi:Mov34-domain-containing protein [Multifurca ochricompacta]|uniref:Eukaryotic translation initiation factor 3 subunit F n=1 Tax=Multifurca ochricompacta TaxID=376703 RepID=A0AAD4LZH1_9AGAM|nr:Mov34-domain-containing protein [Multifurca ochricompacta]
MTLGAPSSGVCLNLSSGPVYRTPSVTIHPAALFSILDHYLRRTDTQQRVIGTLLGTRGEGDDAVSVRGAFAVLHSETSEQVAVDMDYHRAMFDLSQRVNPKESIVGWYSTGSNLNTYSALIQNFYSQETAPYPAIHIALNTGTEAGEEAGVKAYISSPVGVFPKPENAVFVPIPVTLRVNDAERSGLHLLENAPTSPVGELAQLESTLKDVLDMLDRVLAYAQEAAAGKPADAALGRYLMDALGAGTEELGKGGFTSSLQDTLMMSYLANLVRAQAEVSARLALVTAP